MRRKLHGIAAALALFVAGTHLWWAIPQTVRQLQYQQFPDPRPALFLLAAIGIFTALLVVYQGFDPFPFYVAGAVLMVTFIVGYAAWHTVLDHGAFWPGRPGTGHGHGSPLEIVADHLLDPNNRIALASKIGEAALFVVLSVLAVLDYRGELDDQNQTH